MNINMPKTEYSHVIDVIVFLLTKGEHRLWCNAVGYLHPERPTPAERATQGSAN